MNYPIKSGRILLRPMTVSDAPRVYAYRRQPTVARFQGWTPETVTEVEDHAINMQAWGNDIAGRCIQLVIEQQEDPASGVMGDMAFSLDTETKAQAELGIAFDPAFQKQGFAHEAVTGLVSALFDQLKLHRIHVSIDPANRASRMLFERVGFRLEGHLRKSVYFKGAWCDDIVMAVLGEEWGE
ncbi:GNAT family N-acetyltransferase [Paremcibacter congregatus]|uniref:GNAT family N-acetyltransferase n=1 Tax=Paremcibacter congregatus TaxID=2043170 RepID=A0A2G4YQB9_9PROT|nr:GNAT family protein [Paremcibacter congregatus]PHZ84524.1 GNAT family N-acetyltransferase [Paremcibacter congregatus]QDE28743.1 GNAT family N-acetyltransferase [Paremcibacter congregatus]